MQKNMVNVPDLCAALSTGALGLYVFIVGQNFSFGSPRSMGPGFLPEVVGVILILLAIALTVEALRAGPGKFDIQFRPVLTVMLGLTAFAVLIERSGMVPATVALIFLSSLAERPFKPLRTLMLSAGVTIIGIVIFIYLLDLPINIIGI